QRQDFQESGKVVDDETAAESGEFAGRQQQFQRAGNDQQADRQVGNETGGLHPAIGSQHQKHHGARGQHKLRQHGQQLISSSLKAHGALSSPAAITAAARLPS